MGLPMTNGVARQRAVAVFGKPPHVTGARLSGVTGAEASRSLLTLTGETQRVCHLLKRHPGNPQTMLCASGPLGTAHRRAGLQTRQAARLAGSLNDRYR
ncbi:hypothetical protein SKAU_G00005400 [Synaphobranchus kaupii]|uniref:Uncharacterized protein n=1 Tax=Synaphobranchus kaupii TaxID=118154 RepID=A0A9Q1G946_SYNKA|nr:hypothetical protein SKAU_G00005400 [Synaphobranchus kaupii]